MTQAQELKSLLGDQAQREAFLTELEVILPPSHHQRLGRILELSHWLMSLLEMKNLSIAKLRQLCFGASSEKASKVCDKPAKPKKKTKAKGHGRNSHSSYTGAKRVKVPHPHLKSGQKCPQCSKGKLRARKKPPIAIAITAQPPIGALIHEMEQLRCDTCGKLFTAPVPSEAGKEKYDPSVGVMVGLLRYGSGMPFYRLEAMQKSLGVPLPSSVQWEQVDRVARELEPVLDHLIYLAAQSALVFNDDTTMRVSALRKEIQKQIKPKRTGIFTTGIVSQHGHHPIALFFTGRAHAGENLAAVLDRREPERSPPIHMRDGLNRNIPKGHQTVDCSCNVHARRNFVDLKVSFDQECLHVV